MNDGLGAAHLSLSGLWTYTITRDTTFDPTIVLPHASVERAVLLLALRSDPVHFFGAMSARLSSLIGGVGIVAPTAFSE
jgi:hypothetical protein